MNIYGAVILATLLVDDAFNILADALNLRALRTRVPDEFEGACDPGTYRKSQNYTRVNTRFGFLTSTFSLAVLLVFWFTGGFNYLDRFVRRWDINDIWRGLIYIGILVGARLLLGLPFTVYETFVIEERFGFNKTTVKTFVLDLVKGLALAAVLGGPLLAGVLAFLQYFHTWGWLYCWIAVTVFSLFIQFIAPTWILPLFNKFTPLEEGELRDAIFAYAGSVGFPVRNVFAIDGSRRSSKSNAFFTGFGRNKRIALYDTLIARHDTDELVAILAHEIGHYKKRHILKFTIANIVHTGVMFFLLSVFISNERLFEAFYVDKVSVYVGLLFFGMLYAPIELILSIFMNVISRKHEFEADRFAARTIEDREAFVRGLRTLAVHNLSNLTPHWLHVFLHYSHPPVIDRIRAVRAA